jgi:hypothetical protein
MAKLGSTPETEIVKKRIIKNVQNLMEDNKVDARDLAYKGYIAPATVDRMLDPDAGTIPTMHTVIAVAAFFEVDIAELFKER